MANPTYTPTPGEAAGYSGLFSKYDADGDGFVEGREAVPLFTKSGVDRKMLRAVRDMADMDQDSRLNLAEFIVAMHLIVCISRRGLPLPPSVPLELVRAAAAAASAPLPAAAAAAASPAPPAPPQMMMAPPTAAVPQAAAQASPSRSGGGGDGGSLDGDAARCEEQAKATAGLAEEVQALHEELHKVQVAHQKQLDEGAKVAAAAAAARQKAAFCEARLGWLREADAPAGAAPQGGGPTEAGRTLAALCAQQQDRLADLAAQAAPLPALIDAAKGQRDATRARLATLAGELDRAKAQRRSSSLLAANAREAMPQ